MAESDTLRRTALILVWVGLVWNLAEAGVAFWAGVRADSVVLIAFGADSVIELFAGGVLVWRLTREHSDHDDEDAESMARRLVGITFFVLAAYVAVHSMVSLIGVLPRPEPSLIGVVLAVASAVVMSILYVAKMRVAARMQSRALRAEAVESLFCDLQDLAALIGLGFNVWLAWWWADPVASLILVPFFIKEGRENFLGEHDHEHGHGHDEHDEPEHDEPERVAARVCFCLNCFFGLAMCRAACCRA